MTDEIQRWLTENEGPFAWLVLAAAAAAEYVMPPIPGDTITLFGVFLVTTARWRLAPVYVALLAGSIAGSLVAYGFGLFLGRHEDRWPAYLRRDGPRRAIHAVLSRIEHRGALLLVVNRFVPAFRAFVFVGAGMARVPLARVVLFGGASAALWNLVILIVGWTVGSEWETLRAFAVSYAWIASGSVAAVLLALLARYVIRQRRGPRRPSGPASP